MAYEFKVGDTGKTRGGRSYRVLATDLKSDQTIVVVIELPSGEEYVAKRFANGNFYASGTPNDADLIPPTPAVYINVYKRKDGTKAGASTFSSRQAADLEGRGGVRIGCIRVPLEARFDD